MTLLAAFALHVSCVDVRAKAAMVLSNVASVEDNLSLLHLHRASWLSALERLIANKGSRGLEQPKSVVLQALRALTNVSAHPVSVLFVLSASKAFTTSTV